jgi:hypothetical protein
MTRVDIPGGQWEIDTAEDYRLAQREWANRAHSDAK